MGGEGMTLATQLLQWYYLIFLLPFGGAALLLLLTSLRLGGHHHTGMRGHAGHGGHAAEGAGRAALRPAASGGHHKTSAPAARGARSAHQKGTPGKGQHEHLPPTALFLVLLGAGRAPLPLVLEVYALIWGATGYWANRLMLPSAPTASLAFARALPPIGVAALAVVLGGRLTAEVIGRLMPRDETAVVSQEALYGLTGRVVFPVSETEGRVRIYDEFGTLHDEPCRVAAGHTSIAKGRQVMVMDQDPQKRLIVEEIG